MRTLYVRTLVSAVLIFGVVAAAAFDAPATRVVASVSSR
jgi:hypothetical protein